MVAQPGSHVPEQWPTPYNSPDGRNVTVSSNMGVLFSDDFGGSAVDTTRWDILPGGYGTIGTGQNTGITYSVASSALTVAMGTTSGDDLWLMSTSCFAGTEDITVTLSKSQPITANSIFVGLVEVDQTGAPVANPTLANDFNNRGGGEFGATTTTTAFQAQALADGSPAAANGSIGVAAALTTTQEYEMEIHSEDVIVSAAAVDTIAGKLPNASRVSTQSPNDGKMYKLLLRFWNKSAPATNTNVVIQRVLVVNRQEMRVEVASGRGDSNAQKAIAANITGTTNLTTAPLYVNLVPMISTGATTTTNVISAATTNATSVKTSKGNVNDIVVSNNGASAAYFKLYNKASAPTVGTDAPIRTVMIPAGQTVVQSFGTYGLYLATGIAFAVTGGIAASDTTAIAANQVGVSMSYT